MVLSLPIVEISFDMCACQQGHTSEDIQNVKAGILKVTFLKAAIHYIVHVEENAPG